MTSLFIAIVALLFSIVTLVYVIRSYRRTMKLIEENKKDEESQ